MNKLEYIEANTSGIIVRKLLVDNKTVYLLFITQISNRQVINESIIRPILNIRHKEKLSIDFLATEIIYADDIFVSDNADIFLNYVLNGNTVIFMAEEDNYIVINTKNIEKRAVDSPEVESIIKGPKDCFSENFDTNISLIRYRIKDSNLMIDKYSIGTRSRTTVGIIYIKDVANNKYVKDITDKINNINVDSILDSAQLQKLLCDSSFSLFPKMGIAERSDSACGAILDGKVCLIVEGSNLALIAPKTFIEFADSGEDHYENLYVGLLGKFVRVLSILITLIISSLYVMLIGFHMDIIPVKYALILAQGRARVPFPSFVEAFLSEILSEILREASVRLPKQIGPAIGIVGTIVIGQAAVSAGLISPLMVIVIALATMCSFVAPDISIMNSIRILKFILLFLTSIVGVLGFSLGIVIITTALCSIESFGTSYVTPISPFHWSDIKNFILSDISLAENRPNYLHDKDTKRKEKK